MARRFLKEIQFSNNLWGEATSNAVQIINISPTKKMSTKTPYEAWTKLKLGVVHFRISSSLCYQCMLEQLKRKLDYTNHSMILISYH